MSKDIEKMMLNINLQIHSLYSQGRHAEAIDVGKKACAALRDILKDKNKPADFTGEMTAQIQQNLAFFLEELAWMYHDTNADSEQTAKLLKEAVNLQEKRVGQTHPDYVKTLEKLGFSLFNSGDYLAAEEILSRATEMRRKENLDEEPASYALALTDLGMIANTKQDYDTALSFLRQAKHLFHTASQLTAKVPPSESSLPILPAPVSFENDPTYATATIQLGMAYQNLKQFHKAELEYLEAGQVYKRLFGENHEEYATILHNLATIYMERGEYEKAEPSFQRARQIWFEKGLQFTPGYALATRFLAEMCEKSARKEKLREEVIFRRELEKLSSEMYGDESPEHLQSLKDLAHSYYRNGDYANALSAFTLVLGQQEKSIGKDSLGFATTLNNIATAFMAKHDYPNAGSVFKEVETIYRKAIKEGKKDELVLEFAPILNNHAILYWQCGKNDEAEQLLNEALASCSQAYPEGKYPNGILRIVILINNSLAAVYRSKGDLDKAREMHLRCRELWIGSLNTNNAEYATLLDNLAQIESESGRYEEAEPYFKNAHSIYENTVGQENPDYALSLNNYAFSLVARGLAKEALPIMKRVATIEERLASNAFSLSSERQRLNYVKSLRHHLDGFLCLVMSKFSDSEEEKRWVASLVLRRKGIVAETLLAQRDAIFSERAPQLKPLLARLDSLKSEIAKLVFDHPKDANLKEYQKMLVDLNAKKEAEEMVLSAAIPEIGLAERFRHVDQKVIADALSEGSVLLEFIRIANYEFDSRQAKGQLESRTYRYIAFVLFGSDKERVEMIDIGDARTIDNLVRDFKEALYTEAMSGTRQASESLTCGLKLEGLVFKPLRDRLTGMKADSIFISPDGNLSTLPFETLPNGKKGYLIDDFNISYLATGRDLILRQESFTSTPAIVPGDPIVIGDPDYELKIIESGDHTPATRVRKERTICNCDKSELEFCRLESTEREAKEISARLNVRPWTGKDVLESKIKASNSPYILHIATHGFFLAKDEKTSATSDAKDPYSRSVSGVMADGNPPVSSQTLPSANANLPSMPAENPLNCSGLALAGYHSWFEGYDLPKDAEDGMLTAEDVTLLNLLGTELVVLSACETGLGKVEAGEGVFGLRRAFMLAGASSLVLSMWKIPDDETLEIMLGFYDALLQGKSKNIALREAQIEVRKRYPDSPFFWGAFVFQGDPRPLSLSIIKKLSHAQPSLTLRELYELSEQGLRKFPTRISPLVLLQEGDFFMGRRALLSAISSLLFESGSRAPITITGSNGVGKTALAMRTITENQGMFDLVLAVQFESSMSSEALLLALLKTMNIGYGRKRLIGGNLKEKEMAILNELRKYANPIILVDNFEPASADARYLKEFMDRLSSHANVLLTSAARRSLENERQIGLEGMGDDDGAELFLKLAEPSNNTKSLRSAPEIVEILKRISRATNGIPLLIELLAGNYYGGGGGELEDMTKRINLSTKALARNDNYNSLNLLFANCFEYCFSRLKEQEKQLLQDLTVFESPFQEYMVSRVFGEDKIEFLRELERRKFLKRKTLGIESQSKTSPENHETIANTAVYYFHESIREQVALTAGKRQFSTEEVLKQFGKYYLTYVDKILNDFKKQGRNAFKAFEIIIESSFDDSRNDFARALEILEDNALKAEAYRKLASILLEVEQHEKAIRHISRALELDGKLQDSKMLAADYSVKSAILENLGDIRGALRSHAETLRIHSELQDKKNMVEDINRSIWLLDCIGEYDQALSMMDQMKEIYEEADYKSGKAELYSMIGVVLGHKRMPEKALESHTEALKLHGELADVAGLANDYGNIGNMLDCLGRHEAAIENHKRGLQLHEKLRDSMAIARDSNNLGLSLIGLRKYREALEKFSTALRINKQFGDIVETAKAYGNIAIALDGMEMLKEAINAAKSAATINSDLEDNQALARNYSQIGAILYHAKSYDESIEYHNKSLNLNEKLNDLLEMARDHANIAKSLYVTGLKKEALLSLTRAQDNIDMFEKKTGYRDPFGEYIEKMILALTS